MTRWLRPPLLFLLLALAALALWRAGAWVAADPPVDYCYVDTSFGVLHVFGHRPWHGDRDYGTYNNTGDWPKVAAAIGCRLEAR